ncbi:hypothetical protein [Flavihumibacter petaseus]|uniref:Uncharacterized protein n=1 Tax=Flavihumibacter petaseus NBRC 106054 TaxID=1220578 RepID=A0A0E9N4Y5_9BACT|nr:hypothetical protein [Flavihumibacter petaseus]GAO44874.1 hypothetical protein FPE01S_04_01170 [Flavihumibacter petaseus NBRC 106054]
MLFKLLLSGALLFFFPGFTEEKKTRECPFAKEAQQEQENISAGLADHPLVGMALYL